MVTPLVPAQLAPLLSSGVLARAAQVKPQAVRLNWRGTHRDFYDVRLNGHTQLVSLDPLTRLMGCKCAACLTAPEMLTWCPFKAALWQTVKTEFPAASRLCPCCGDPVALCAFVDRPCRSVSPCDYENERDAFDADEWAEWARWSMLDDDSRFIGTPDDDERFDAALDAWESDGRFVPLAVESGCEWWREGVAGVVQ